ncbi:sulfatase [Brevundimonas terrae]|uniref:Sulfatase n=1 Tax=Brevundimonas terrae TaxID=363631 RepID=A0ABN0Y7L4_9CAUL|nr:sulfatase-like hydrolase/transferase [Brevundimonas terrae]NIJ25323.1 arylsulfatase [Brevundimonas terrae]
MSSFDRRQLMAAMAAAATGIAPPLRAQAASKSAQATANEKPLNILFICTDQEFGLQSYPQGLLEHLPGHRVLLERSVELRNYHVQTTPCTPSRAVIYTGQHTQKTRVFSNAEQGAVLTPEIDTIGDMMRRAGYYSAYKGKWHLAKLSTSDQSFQRLYNDTTDAMEPFGFSDYNFNGEEIGLTWAGYRTDRHVTGDAAMLIHEFATPARREDKPWFLCVNLVNPHDIMFYDATGEQADTRAVRNLAGLMRAEPGDPLYQTDLGMPLPRSFYVDDLSTKPEAHRGISALDVKTYGAMPRENETAWKRFYNYYCNCLRDVDQNILTLLWALEHSGQLDNTIIVYTSDHGERAGAHGMRQKGGTAYKEETNVPMFIAHPQGARGVTSKTLMGAVDLAPTLLGLAGKSQDWSRSQFPQLVGHDVSKAVFDPAHRGERDRQGHLFNYGVILSWDRLNTNYMDTPVWDLSKRRAHRGVFDGRWKFVRYFAPAEHHMPRKWEQLVAHNDLELYDTHKDPDEVLNLANRPNEYRAEIERLNAMVNALIEHEIGEDNGSEFPGPVERYNTLTLT